MRCDAETPFSFHLCSHQRDRVYAMEYMKLILAASTAQELFLTCYIYNLYYFYRVLFFSYLL